MCDEVVVVASFNFNKSKWGISKIKKNASALIVVVPLLSIFYLCTLSVYYFFVLYDFHLSPWRF